MRNRYQFKDELKEWRRTQLAIGRILTDLALMKPRNLGKVYETLTGETWGELKAEYKKQSELLEHLSYELTRLELYYNLNLEDLEDLADYTNRLADPVKN
jgi:hypothetical protein